jgi:Ca-activated chloride channel family protein
MEVDMKTLRSAILFVVFVSSAVFPNGVAIIDAHKAAYLRLDSTIVRVSVQSQISTTVTTQYFTNIDSSTRVKYAFPLAEQASAIRLRWNVSNQWYTASVAGTSQDTTLPGGGNPEGDLVSYLGGTPLYFSIPQTIGADSTLSVELTYVELLPYSFGNVKYVYPGDYHLIQSGAIGLQQFVFQLASLRTIDSIRVLSSHAVEQLANSGTTADITITLHEAYASENLIIQYSLNATQLGLFAYSSLFAGSEVPDSLGNGFLTFIAEPDPSPTSVTIAKVFTLIVDRSGSMSGTKIEQARNAASFIVQNLNEGDRFNLIDFDDVITVFRPGHVLFTPSTRDSALQYINTLTARNMTSISGAFATAVPQFTSASDSTANIIIFLTDGLPTAGITDLPTLATYIDGLIKSSERRISVFSFGIGFDANRQLLSLISSQHNGVAEFLGNDELYSRITDFYRTIRNPVLLDSHISFSPSVVTEVFPDSLPNLYKGKQMIVTGRYQHGAPVQITLRGTAYGKAVSYGYPVELADTPAIGYQFLQKIWAKQKIESLLVHYYSMDPGSEAANALKNQIIAISQAYGVITEFTSYTDRGSPIGLGGTGVEKGKVGSALISSQFELLGNYPNPFNPSTTIRIRLNANYAGVIVIRVYNIVGQLIRTLRLVATGPGVYEVNWDGLSEKGVTVSSGAYFYAVELHNTIHMGRMNLVK